jgi:hypothetical protein
MNVDTAGSSIDGVEDNAVWVMHHWQGGGRSPAGYYFAVGKIAP